MTPIRYAIWTAVSTEAQARPDKVSLEDQLIRCRASADSHQWVEGSGHYQVDGESRTRWVNLSDAENEIPALRSMLNAAERKQFDVLILYDYNRLRDLLDQVARVLANYGIQLYSISQPIEPQNPEEYNPNRADSAWMMQGMSQIVSRSQIHDLRRKYESGMPARVRDRGIPAISIPFGYRKPPGREADALVVPVRDPIKSPLVVKFKDLLLAGYSLSKIVQFANGTGIAPPRGKTWYAASIRDILRNPFYAGYNRWGMSKSFTDLRTGKRKRNRDINPSDVIVELGKHEPLWDISTHERLVSELDQRGNAYSGKKATPLSRLLVCSACKKPLWRAHNGARTEPERAIWRCSNRECRQANILHSHALDQLSAVLVAELIKYPDPRPPQETGEEPPASTLALEELMKRRRRLLDLYIEQGIEKPEYLRKSAELDTLIQKAEAEISEARAQALARREHLELIKSFTGMIQQIPEFIHEHDPVEVNKALVMLLEYAEVTGEKITAIKFRE